MQKEIHVLYVDDEEANLIAFRANFRKQFTVYTASSAAEAKQVLAENPVSVLITDQRMPEITGSQLLAEAAKTYPNQMRILLSAYSDIEALTHAVNEGYIFKFLKKPWNDAEIIEAVEEAYRLYKWRMDLIEKEQKFNAWVEKVNQIIDTLKDKLGSDDEV